MVSVASSILEHQRRLFFVAVPVSVLAAAIEWLSSPFAMSDADRMTINLAVAALFGAAFSAAATAAAIILGLGRGPRLDHFFEHHGHRAVRQIGSDLCALFIASLAGISSAALTAAEADAFATGLLWAALSVGLVASLHFLLLAGQLVFTSMSDLQILRRKSA